MKIMMLTNTFTPHVGGVARSVQSFSDELRKLGHQVLVLAPNFAGAPEQESGVVRLPAIQHFTGSDFSIPLPLPGRVTRALNFFEPEILHTHHPFLLGDTALRIAGTRNLPVVFTHHTLYENYTHYLVKNSSRLRQFALDLASGFCNLCDAVIAPSQSLARLLLERGVHCPVEVIPTGVDLSYFSPGNADSFRDGLGIPRGAFVVGHVGRLAPEKQPLFLATAVARFLREQPVAHFLLVGTGPSAQEMEGVFSAAGLQARLHRVEVLPRDQLVGAYRAMNVFAFASQSETQGMVLTEALATGVPIVAINGPGVREVVRDGCNGRLLQQLSEDEFSTALDWVATLSSEQRKAMRQNALDTAGDFSVHCSTDKLLTLYRQLLLQPNHKDIESSDWATLQRLFRKERELLLNIVHASEHALHSQANKK